MTREQKLEAVSLRLDGKSLEYIGDALGCTRQNISQFFKSLHRGDGRRRGAPLKVEQWKYPALAEWLNEKRMSIPELAANLGIKPCTIRRWFRGGTGIPYWRKAVIEKICDFTGISEEELLRKREGD